MANNNRIKLLRGNSTQIANSNKVLSYGQPLYNEDKNYITVGNSAGTKQVKAQPITVREVIGYYGDSTTISNSTSNQYKLSGDATNKTYLNTPDTFNINVNNVNKVSIDGTTATIKENVVVDSTYKITGTITNAENVANTIGSIPLTDIFESSGTSITSTVKNATNAQYANSATNADNATNATNAVNASYASSDHTKGTIEQRLTNLGFREGSITQSVGSATTNKLYRQGNYCFCDLVLKITNSTSGSRTIGTIPELFRPTTTVSQFAGSWNNTTGSNRANITYLCEISSNGNIKLTYVSGTTVGTADDYNILIHMGWECSPIS